MSTVTVTRDEQPEGRSPEGRSPASDVEEHEASRLGRRASVRRQIAKLELRQQQVGELRRVIDSISTKSDEAANEHAAKCEPLQAELAELHEKQLDEITSKKESSEADAARRQELLRQLADHNSELEKVVGANRATIKKIEEQIRELTSPNPPEGYNLTTLRNELCGPLARPALRIRMFALRERNKHCLAWAEAAKSQSDKFQVALNNPERYVARDVAAALDGFERWTAAQADAVKIAGEAMREAAEIREVCLSED